MSDPSGNLEDDIIRSWVRNAEPWQEAVQSRSIASRRLVTDQAIVDAVCRVEPRRVLDIGCGEGWLVRALARLGMDAVGFDVVPALIDAARLEGIGRFEIGSYASLAAGLPQLGAFDVTVCNFSLLGEMSVTSLIRSVGRYLRTHGSLIVQTLHPVAACGDLPYRDGWRAGSWRGFGPRFVEPAPWFFRTMSSWYAMLRDGGFEVVEYLEPTAHDAFVPSSVIFICRLSGTPSDGMTEAP